MTQKKTKLAHIAIPSFFALLQACHTHNVTDEPDPMFAEKKRPQYNQVFLNKQGNQSDYQEVNSSFANEYQNANKTNAQGNVFVQRGESSTDAIQRLRDEAARYNYKLVPNQEYLAPTRPVAPIAVQPPLREEYAETQYQEPDLAIQQSYGTETFEIQAGAYKSEAGAMKIVQKLENSGVKNARVQRNAEGQFAVRINNGSRPFATRDDASKTMQEIIERTQHYDIMVVKNKI